MRYLIALAAAAALAGCATQAFESEAQNYRPKGDDTPVEIKGAVFVKPGAFENDMWAGIYFNERLQIEVQLNKHGSGEAAGSPYAGKPTSATCNGEPVARNNLRVRCMVFVDNERAVTLTF